MNDRGKSPHFFDPWLTLAQSTASVDALATGLDLAFTETAQHRKRRRKPEDERNLQIILHTVFANLAYAAIIQPPACCSVVVPLARLKRKRSRYDRRGFRQLRNVLHQLDAAGVLSLTISLERGRASTIEPSPWFVETIRAADFHLHDFGRAEGEESIVLSRSKADHVTGRRYVDWLDYSDTRETRRYRDEMHRINAAPANAELAFLPGRGVGLDVHTRRKLHRVFHVPADNPPDEPVRFNQGGRLYGGWWQNLPKAQRRHIRIDGEPIADLDFRSMFIRLAYLRVGVIPPEGDLYGDIFGFEDECWREGVKQVFLALLGRSTPMMRLPRGSKALLPPGTTAADLRTAILARHPDLAPIIEIGMGHALTFTESEILVAILLRLIDEGIIALPMHDGLMVAQSKADRAEIIMRDVAEELTGCRLPVERMMPSELSGTLMR